MNQFFDLVSIVFDRMLTRSNTILKYPVVLSGSVLLPLLIPIKWIYFRLLRFIFVVFWHILCRIYEALVDVYNGIRM